MAYLAGAYTGTLGGLSLGTFELDSVRLSWQEASEDIVGDNLGESIQDGVYRGGNCFVDFIGIEWSVILLALVGYPYLGTLGRHGTVGVLKSSFASVLVLTKVSGPNASPTSITAGTGVQPSTVGGAVFPRGYPFETLLAPRLRRVPIRMQLLPYVSSGNMVWFVPV